jgi:hypothetical protein
MLGNVQAHVKKAAVPPLLVLHLGKWLGEAHVESSGCPVEVDAPHEVLRAKAIPSRIRAALGH